MDLVDFGMSVVPREPPSVEKARRAKIVAHRGSTETGEIENTLKAFDQSVAAGAWAVEFDVRFTKDDIAVVHHDKSCLRTFGVDISIAKTSFESLRSALPQIPTLKETIAHLKDRAHLMIEIKKCDVPTTRKQANEIGYLLSHLEAAKDYHLMSLEPKALLKAALAPNRALLAIAEFDLISLSRLVLEEKMGGFTAHYALLTQRMIDRHLAADQKLGTGFTASRSVLYREIDRGIDWIYTNDATQVAQFKQDLEHR